MDFVEEVADSVNNLFSTILSYANSHRDGIIALLLMFGIVLSFTGKAVIRLTVFLLGFIPTTTVMTTFGVALITDLNPHSSSSKYVIVAQVLVVVVSLFLGVLVGFVMVRLLFRVTTFLICGASGAIMVCIIYLLFLRPSHSRSGLFVWYAFMLLAAVIAALLSVSYPDSAVILGTSIDGAAIAVMCIAWFLGHRPTVFDPIRSSPSPIPSPISSPIPSPSALPAHSSNDELWAMVYAFSVILLAIFGAITQYRISTANEIVAEYTGQQRRRAQAERDSYHDTSVIVPLRQDQGTEVYTTATLVEGAPTDKSALRMPTRFVNPSRYLMPPSSDNNQERVTIIEPPGSNSPGGNSNNNSYPIYGATEVEDAQYSVMHNLGAQPLTDAEQQSSSYKRDSKQNKDRGR